MKRPLYREPCLLFVTTDFSNKTRADQHLRANVDHCLDPSRIALGTERQNTHIENRVIIHRESVHSRVEIELVRLQTRQVVGQIMAKLDRIRVLRLAFRCYDVCFERKAVLNDDREGLGAILVRERGERVEEGVFAVGEETNGGFVDDAVEGTKNGEDRSGWNGEAEPHSEIGEEGDVETEACGGLIGLDLVQYERNDFIGKVPIVESTDQKKIEFQLAAQNLARNGREHIRESRRIALNAQLASIIIQLLEARQQSNGQLRILQHIRHHHALHFVQRFREGEHSARCLHSRNCFPVLNELLDVFEQRMNEREAIGSREGVAKHRYHDRLERGCVEIGVGNDGEERVDDLEHARLV